MRKLALWLAFLAALSLALPAFAQDADPPWDDEESEDESSAFDEYGGEVGNRFLMGLNSFVTFPADPVMSAVEPRGEFEELPLGSVTKYPAGFFQGSILMVYRAYTGVLDMAFAPLTPMKMLSPEPRYMLFDDVEHDEY